MEIKVYHLHWEKYNCKNPELDTIDKKYHKGIYQIYGTHHIYGRNTLLYIGKTTEQTFRGRIDQHWDFNVNHFPEFSYICLGMLLEIDDGNSKNISKIIEDIEKLLINSHCPAFNSNDIKGLKEYSEKDQFVIINWGNYDQMLPEISTLKFSNKYWDEDKYKFKIINTELE